MKTLLLQLWEKFKALLASHPKGEFKEWEAGHKEKEAYKQERAKWKALQQINMLL
ncbi:MAG: hypothetical protein R3E32_07185 [Chitinophagales bacterium]